MTTILVCGLFALLPTLGGLAQGLIECSSARAEERARWKQMKGIRRAARAARHRTKDNRGQRWVRSDSPREIPGESSD